MTDIYSERRVKEIVHDGVRELCTEQKVREIIHDEVRDLCTEQRVREIVHDEVRDLCTEQRVKEIVHDEVSDIRVTLAEHSAELRRLGGLFEAFQSDLKLVLELLTGHLQTARQVTKHTGQIGRLETGQKLLTATVAGHSRQLKAR